MHSRLLFFDRACSSRDVDLRFGGLMLMLMLMSSEVFEGFISLAMPLEL